MRGDYGATFAFELSGVRSPAVDEADAEDAVTRKGATGMIDIFFRSARYFLLCIAISVVTGTFMKADWLTTLGTLLWCCASGCVEHWHEELLGKPTKPIPLPKDPLV